MTDHVDPVRRGRWWGPAATLAVAGLWLALAVWRPDTTFHLAPVLVTASWAATLRWAVNAAALGHGRAAWCVAGAGLVAVASTAGLTVSGHLAGPDLLGGSSAPHEAVLLVAATAPVTWWSVTRTGRTPGR
jgi:hypothetical protein